MLRGHVKLVVVCLSELREDWGGVQGAKILMDKEN